MFKFVILFAVIAAAAAGLAPAVPTPLSGRSLAFANTEHAGYVGGLKPITNQYLSLPATYSAFAPNVYSAGHVPLPYADRYVAYAAPIQASYLGPIPY